jgi:hypothetical protein
VLDNLEATEKMTARVCHFVRSTIVHGEVVLSEALRWQIAAASSCWGWG